MAKRPVQQIQVEINNDEEFEKFIQKSGLLALDVYPLWCGPCLALLPTLRKVKLDIGGDLLQLATCSADNVEKLKRFRNSCEPRILMMTKGKVVNMFYGAKVPLLVDVLRKELDRERRNLSRTLYDISIASPVEAEREKERKSRKDAKVMAEYEKEASEAREFLMSSIEIVAEKMPNAVVSIFGPHIDSSISRKITAQADKVGLLCRDFRTFTFTEEMVEVLNSECTNGLPLDVWEHMVNKELVVALWTKPESDPRTPYELASLLIHQVTFREPILNSEGEPTGRLRKPMIAPFKMKVKVQKAEITEEMQGEEEEDREMVDIEYESGGEQETDLEEFKEDILLGDLMTSPLEIEPLGEPIEDSEEGMRVEEEEMAGEEVVSIEEEERKLVKPIEEEEESERESFFDGKIVWLPPIWSPNTLRGNAYATFAAFRNHTFAYVPPEPPPDPPVITVVFDAYKRKQITDVWEKHKEDILLYGYFTSSDPDSAELITSSNVVYEKRGKSAITDKLVFKVAKRTSHPILALVPLGPTYISPNPEMGKRECKKFFPKGYQNVDEKKKKKKPVGPSRKSSTVFKERSQQSNVGTEYSGAEPEGDLK